ncbi:MAG: protein-methionine-sulfoxide reductase catalytic subunit MsrP [Tahibacter sp.]
MTMKFAIPRPSEITRESVYLKRRELLKAIALGAPLLASGCGGSDPAAAPPSVASPPGQPLSGKTGSPFNSIEVQTAWADATSYNNYYEFGTGKADPGRNSAAFKARPWSVEIAGHAEVTGRFDLADFMRSADLEERVYRLRCVEAWSMVIPWIGIPLGACLARFKPTSRAKYVAFTTVQRPAEMPGQAYAVLDWPYREGLRIDEAMNPLALLVSGMYGRELPNQNGAPLRLVAPWKYGYKSIKSIVKIDFTETQPRTSWNDAGPDEYGFYSNVNPAVDHPRWSQRTERRIAGGGVDLFGNRVQTLPFNGYAEQVAGMYAGMDLRKNF